MVKGGCHLRQRATWRRRVTNPWHSRELKHRRYHHALKSFRRNGSSESQSRGAASEGKSFVSSGVIWVKCDEVLSLTSQKIAANERLSVIAVRVLLGPLSADVHNVNRVSQWHHVSQTMRRPSAAPFRTHKDCETLMCKGTWPLQLTTVTALDMLISNRGELCMQAAAAFACRRLFTSLLASALDRWRHWSSVCTSVPRIDRITAAFHSLYKRNPPQRITSSLRHRKSSQSRISPSPSGWRRPRHRLPTRTWLPRSSQLTMASEAGEVSYLHLLAASHYNLLTIDAQQTAAHGQKYPLASPNIALNVKTNEPQTKAVATTEILEAIVECLPPKQSSPHRE